MSFTFISISHVYSGKKKSMSCWSIKLSGKRRLIFGQQFGWYPNTLSLERLLCVLSFREPFISDSHIYQMTF